MADSYEFRGNYYCSGHVSWMLDSVPGFMGQAHLGWMDAYYGGDHYGAMRMMLDYDAQARADLLLLAQAANINAADMSNPEIFPVLLDSPPEPDSFCSECLRWFTPPIEREEEE